MEAFSFYICRMDNILTNVETGHQYIIQPSVQELESGIIQYVPELHAYLWDYILCNGQLYSNLPDLVDWDQGVEEWKKSIMSQWPSGTQLSTDQKLINEALDCLDSLDSYLQFEEWEMEQIEAQEEVDDDDDDDDDDNEVDVVSEDDDDDEVDQWNFGITPMLWHIQL